MTVTPGLGPARPGFGVRQLLAPATRRESNAKAAVPPDGRRAKSTALQSLHVAGAIPAGYKFLNTCAGLRPSAATVPRRPRANVTKSAISAAAAACCGTKTNG